MTPSFLDAYDAHADAVFRFLAYRTPSREVAEDLTQATFEKALRAWPRFDPVRASALTWLLTIARNTLIDHVRANRTDAVPVAELPVDEGTEDRPAIGLAPDLERALAGLSDRDREIVALRYAADLNGPEIAQITGLSLANVQQILSRSLRQLRATLDQG